MKSRRRLKAGLGMRPFSHSECLNGSGKTGPISLVSTAAQFVCYGWDMQLLDDAFLPLGRGTLYSFRDWPNPDVPRHGAGVYTIWHQDGRFIYVGMSGRAITKDTAISTPYGIYTRLRSHASGCRSGDQFSVYVADRLVLPTLSQPEIPSIAAGEHRMDAFVRRFIHENLSYRFVVVPDGATAFTAVASISLEPD